MRNLVTDGKWAVSYETGSGIDGAILKVYQIIEHNAKGERIRYKVKHGDHYGKRFDSIETATQFAFKRGYLQRHVIPWCRTCRTVHVDANSRRSPFCHQHARIIFEQPFAPKLPH